jgi:hypothetical protein
MTTKARDDLLAHELLVYYTRTFNGINSTSFVQLKVCTEPGNPIPFRTLYPTLQFEMQKWLYCIC